MTSSPGSATMSSSSEADLTFACRDGRTVLAASRVRAPMALVRPFPLDAGGRLVQLITIGPGLCAGDVVRIRIAVECGARVVVTTPAATRILSMDAGRQAAQHVDISVAAGGTLEYYPAVTIPFPESALVQTTRIDAAPESRVGVLETWAMGRTSRGEYLQFRMLSSRTSLYVDGAIAYADAIELCPARDSIAGAGMMAGRRYVASGFWYGAALPAAADTAADAADLVVALGQSRPGLAFLRAIGSDAPALDRELRAATERVAAAWNHAPVTLDRFRC
jgi:urease accessory protein